MKGRNYICIIALIVFLSFCMSACVGLRKAPNINLIEKEFREYKQEFTIIVDYFISSGIVHGAINKNDGTIDKYFEEWGIPIDDQAVVDAVNLLSSHYDDFSVYRDSNTITFTVWVHPQNISSSIAYSINHVDLPDMQTPTEIIPMTENGWYYVIEDYNKWMVENPPYSRPDADWDAFFDGLSTTAGTK